MASGDIANVTAGSFQATLLDAVSGAVLNDGVWVDCGEYTGGTVIALGAATTAVVTVNGHNGLTRPANAVVGAVLTTGAAGAAVFSPQTVLPKWIKASVSVIGTGTITAVLVARKY